MFAKGQIAQEKEQPRWGRFLNKKIVKRYVACDDDMDHCYEIDIRYKRGRKGKRKNQTWNATCVQTPPVKGR